MPPLGGLPKIPDKIYGEFTRSWVINQSETVGSFDNQYLLHVHETVKEAKSTSGDYSRADCPLSSLYCYCIVQ